MPGADHVSTLGTGSPAPRITRVTRFRAVRPARPGLTDLVLTLLCIVAMGAELVLREQPGRASVVVMIVLNSLPVLVRRQSPAVALGLCFVLLFGLSELDADIYSTIPGPGCCVPTPWPIATDAGSPWPALRSGPR